MKWTVVSLLAASAATAQTVPPRFELDYEAIAKKIVERLDMKEGETFLQVARPGMFDALIPLLRYEAMKAGAIDLGVIDVMAEPVPETWDASVLSSGGRRSREALRDMLRGVDASIMLPGANPGQPVYAAIQDLLNDGHGRTIHFHWLENGSAFPIPGQPLPPRHEIERVYQRALLEADYDAVAAHQHRFATAMRGGEVRVTSPMGTDLKFRVGSRPVNFQNGQASKARTDEGVILIDREIELPFGAIRIAPLEPSVKGTIVFPPSQWAGKPVTGLTLVFEEGNVVSVSAESGEEHARAEMERAGVAGGAFREFALGFHPLLAVPDTEPWIPYYGYGDGVVRLSLGDNSELGGDVEGDYVRWNFFIDTTVTIDGDLWVDNGKLVK